MIGVSSMTAWYEWLLTLAGIPVALYLLVKLLEYFNPEGKSFHHFTGNLRKRDQVLQQLSYELSLLEQEGIEPAAVFNCKNCNRATYGVVEDGTYTEYCSICTKKFPVS